MTVTTVKRFGDANGGTVIVDKNRIPELMAALPAIKAAAVKTTAKGFEEVLKATAQTGGFGTWTRKSPEQMDYLDRRGGPAPNSLMSGLTLALLNNIEIDMKGTDNALVGWGSTPHPDPGLLGTGRRTRVPTLGELAAVHQFGVRKGSNLTESPWSFGSKGSLLRVPARPWPTLAVDKRGDPLVKAMRGILSNRIGQFNSLPKLGAVR